jgi:hypothetical protein
VAFAGIGEKKTLDKIFDALTLAMVFVIPPIIGSIAGYYVVFDHTYFFALGLGASVYAVAGCLTLPRESPLMVWAALAVLRTLAAHPLAAARRRMSRAAFSMKATASRSSRPSSFRGAA